MEIEQTRDDRAAVTSESEDLAASLRAERADAIRVRAGRAAWAGVGIVAVFFGSNFFTDPSASQDYPLTRVFSLGALFAFALATERKAFNRHAYTYSLVLGSLICIGAASAGMMRGDLVVSAMLLTVIMMLASTTLPWGARFQGTLAAVAITLLGRAAYQTGPFLRTDAAVPVLIIAVVTLSLSIVIAYRTRVDFDEKATENFQLRAAEAHIHVLNAGLEEKVKSRTLALYQSLNDQRSMAHTISHDLRQPLRHVNGFARMLEEDLGGALDDGHRELLSRMCSATARGGLMIDALLELSRVSDRAPRREDVDLSEFVTEVVRSKEAADSARKVELIVAPNLHARADRALVHNLLEQLLANAWKFTRDVETTRIEFGIDEGRFFVRDNGSGFDMEHESKLFIAFEKLHGIDEFEGEGMGLAIAARIVRRHGGSIEAEGEPGKGATFFFTLGDEGGAAQDEETEMGGDETAPSEAASA